MQLTAPTPPSPLPSSPAQHSVTSIHPTAVVHPAASVAAGCYIGPYCVVGEHVVLGQHCHLHSHVVIDGFTRLGQHNEVFPFACIGLKTQDLKWAGGITRTEIGDYNTFREYVTINSATGEGEVTSIGSHNHILAYCHVAHNVTLGSHIIMSNVATLAGHICVEDYAVIGGLAAIHQFCRIGKMSMIGGCSKVVQDVPPFMIGDGNPARTRTINKVGLDRNGINDDAQTALKAAYRILFREGLAIPNALTRIEAELPPLPEVQHLIGFIRASERGISK
jgi:UDP-N-acetylglucosamine acyltransferase